MDELHFSTNPDHYYVEATIAIPEPSGWACYLFGGNYLVWYPEKGQVPNRFWRWMQYLCFGNRWVKE
jgi:hypothetical protein